MTAIEEKTLPSGWKWAKLGDVCRIVNGTTPDTTRSEYWDGTHIWITPADLGKLQGNLITTSARRITQAGYESCGTEIVPPGSVVLSSRAPIGHLAIADVPLCTNQGCKTLVPSHDITSAYLYFSLKQAVPQLQVLGSGATFAEVSKAQVANFEIPLPPLQEQKRIAAILTEQLAAVDRARVAAEAQLQAAKQLPAAFLSAVFDSAEAQQWPKQSLKDICSDISDGTHFTPTYIPAGIPFLSVKDVKEDGISFQSCRYISEDEHNHLCKRCKPEKGDVLYTKVGTTGVAKAIDVDEEFSIFVSVALLKLKPGIRPGYIERVLNAPIGRTQAENLTQGMANRNLVLQDLKRIEVPIPPTNKQEEVADVLENHQRATAKVIQSAKDQLNVISQLPNTLLRQAFAGDV